MGPVMAKNSKGKNIKAGISATIRLVTYAKAPNIPACNVAEDDG